MTNKMTVDITASTVFRIILILIGFWLLFVVFDIVLMIFSAIIIASVIEPIANYFQRYKIPRALTVLIVFLLFIGILSGVITLMIDPLITQTKQLAAATPRIISVTSNLVGYSPDITHDAILATAHDVLFGFGDNLTKISRNVLQGTANIFSGIFTLLFIIILSFYLVIEKDALKKFFRIVTPQKHMAYVEQAVDRAQRQLGRWLLAQLALGIIIGTIVGLGLWLIGVPYALVLGLVSGLLEIIPVIGPILAAIPGVLVGLSQSTVIGLVALGFYIVVQQLENHLLIPNLMRKAVGLNPLVTIIAILLGARLAGVVGMLLSVPVATVISIIMSDIFKRSNNQP